MAKRYQVVGGQYTYRNYGESDSVHGAKCIAAKHDEYWDNWQGWHRPLIYRIEDCFACEGTYYPKAGAIAISYGRRDRCPHCNNDGHKQVLGDGSIYCCCCGAVSRFD